MICINGQRHAELAQKVMQMGYHVYTEKPPAETAADALATARVSKDAGRLCMTAFKKRYNNAYSRARQWLDQYATADLLLLSIDYCCGPYDDALPADTFLYDFALHAIDLAGFLFGDAEYVFATARGSEAYAVSIKFVCGAVGTLSFSSGRSFAIPTEEVEITVRGGNCMTVHNSSNWRIAEKGRCIEWREPRTFTASGDSGHETGHLSEIEEFLAAIHEGRTTRSSIYESYKSMVVYEAIRKSAREKQTVSVLYDAI